MEEQKNVSTKDNLSRGFNEKQFEEYKRRIVNEDIKKVEINYKIRWFEWFPVLGAIFYLLRMGILFQSINRGLLRKNITKYQLYLQFGTIFIYNSLLIFLPCFMYFVINLGLKNTKKELAENKT